jgi:pimeloyl-ACP methyl ester carboxylesterase
MSYRTDLTQAKTVLARRDREELHDSRFGVIEYGRSGEGVPVLASHPLFGGFDTGLSIARTYFGDGYEIVAPSRFGYLGSSLPPDATPAGQADAYAAVLDAVGVDTAIVFGYSAGGTSALQFALRHRDRTRALVLLAPALPGKAGRPPRLVADLLFGSDRFFWALRRFAPAAFARLLGMPKGFRPTASDSTIVDEAEASLFPTSLKKPGVLFDLYEGNPSVQTLPLEQIAAPTAVISARDDGLSAFDNAVSAVDRIPEARLIAYDDGGHLLLGRQEHARGEVARFLTDTVAGER